MFGKSSLKLCYVIMAKEHGRFWLRDQCWGAKEGHDMYDALIFRSRRDAKQLGASLEKETSIYEIGLYNGKPVLLIDAYQYCVDAKYTPKEA